MYLALLHTLNVSYRLSFSYSTKKKLREMVTTHSRIGSVAAQHLLAQGCLLELSTQQQIGFGLRFAETKFSINMWLQSYGSRILITTP
jgi:hypothetical protein